MKTSLNRLNVLLLIALMLWSSLSLFAQDGAANLPGDPELGKKLFNAQCAACHKLDKKLVGPAMAGVTERRSQEWLIKWIRNNAELRASGDKDAIAIYEEYNKSAMPAFPLLSDQDILNILAYTIVGDKPAAAPAADQGAPATGAAQPKEGLNIWVLVALSSFLLVLLLILVKVKNTLKVIKGEEPTSVLEDFSKGVQVAVKNQKLIVLLTIVVSVFLLKELYWGLMSIGVEQGYMPEQPIAFSHKIHAGDNGIDCKYCHYGAEKGKHSNIPSAMLCMNCHTYIQEGPKYGTKEIDKIYAAVGFDRESNTYIPGYEQKPVKWVRVHNLPDLAYFNHAQHVNVAGLECQTCHGPVQEMEVLYQYSELTMGWCINCHRETEINVENGYYKDLHDKLKEKYKSKKVTAEMIGGLECGKCHY
ncbi:c-type cytochrome [Thermaurantimonas aggregans]|uniref:c-type cytochrome n=1 Tax=Thermaurantimonas aggregans TaxID=2173829 RepID=UPI0023F58825|nr:c-type cytochrome [Thermaurantimonas aggregans]MCX8148725.1 c-type cytochrome [Thermaurantimonas aggregans]